jgi:general secretion pathway protein M
MIARTRIWYVSRSLREQRLIAAMAALFVIVFVWLLVLRPLGDALADARERHDEAVLARAQAKAQAEALGSLRTAGGTRLTEPAETVIARAAAEAGFQLSRIQPDPGGTVSISIEAARPQALFGWVSQLESRGVVVSTFSATANADRTLAVQASFRGRTGA